MGFTPDNLRRNEDMKLTIYTLALALAATSALATGGGNQNGPQGGNASSNATAIAGGGDAYATGGSATQGQIQGQSQGQTQSVANTNASVSAPGMGSGLCVSVGVLGQGAGGVCLPVGNGWRHRVAMIEQAKDLGQTSTAINLLNADPMVRRANRRAPAPITYDGPMEKFSTSNMAAASCANPAGLSMVQRRACND